MTWHAVKNVLCVRLDQMGDLLMTTPALRAVEGKGKRRVTLLASSAGASAARHIPEVTDIIMYDPPWMKHSMARADAALEQSIIEKIRAGHFDAGIIFNVFSQSALPAALILYLAQVPRRLAHIRENPYQLLTDWVEDREPLGGIRHEVQRQIDLVKTVGWHDSNEKLSFSVPFGASQCMRARIYSLGLHSAWLVVHPGATASSRRYPPRLFAQALRRLIGRGWQVVFTGSREEVSLIEEIRTRLPGKTVSFAGELELSDLAALIQQAPLLLTNNTGPSHIAAAVGTPVVTLYALTNPQHTPWNVPSQVLFHDVPCRNCFKSICPEGHQHCLTLVDPDEVAGACERLFESTREPFYGGSYADTRN